MSDERVTLDDTRAVDEPAGSGPPATVVPASTTTRDEEAGDELARVTAERDDYLNALRRLHAQFDNFRNRIRRDQKAKGDRAVAKVVDRIRPVLDAVDAVDAARAHHPDAFAPVSGVLHATLLAPEG